MSDMWSIIHFLICLALVVIATEAVTEILVASKLLDIIRLRGWAAKKAIPPDADFSKVYWYHTALYTLLTCGYCQSKITTLTTDEFGAFTFLSIGCYLTCCLCCIPCILPNFKDVHHKCPNCSRSIGLFTRI